MKKEDAEEFTQSLGQIAGGTWRQIALAKRLGVPKALGLSVEGWVKKLGGYTRLSIEDRREAVQELTAEGQSTREIAEVLGTSAMTVSRDLGVTNGTDESAQPADPHDGDGAAVTSVTDTEDETSNGAVSEGGDGASAPLSVVTDDEPDVPNGTEPLSVVATLVADERFRAAAKSPHVSYNSGENRWNTPRRYIDMAAVVMGGIDCDPASSDKANETVGAATYYTIEDDGLTKPWHGRVWMNPPYAQPTIKHFAETAASKYMSGEISEAIVLVNNATDTEWFQGLARASSALCFLNGRICFINHEGATGQSNPVQGQAVLYLGKRADWFVEVFANEGLVYVGSGSPDRTSSGRPYEVREVLAGGEANK
jgi:phage N-6-adenine-methyltransferase